MRERLQRHVELGALRSIDVHFALRMESWAGGDCPQLLLAAALVSHRVGEGDVCVDLSACEELPLFHGDVVAERIALPNTAEWRETLRSTSVVGAPGERAPLILDDDDRLYLGRYWHFERVLVDALARRAGKWVPGVDRKRLRQSLARLFTPTEGVDWQRVAAALAVLRPLCVVSGGPGTGKTRVVTAILALLVQQDEGASPRIALAAPTGKAAARLMESIRAAKTDLDLGREIADRVPEQAVTLHRLLGFRPGRANPGYGPENPLHADVVVVDEASMVDLPLMARLVEALPERARLILLGDKDQLASVEAGMVLGDICGRDEPRGYSQALSTALGATAGVVVATRAEGTDRIADHIVVLRKSWRFEEASGIGALATAVNRGDPHGALAILEDGTFPEVSLTAPAPAALETLIREHIVPAYRDVVGDTRPENALRALNRVRVLCAVRDGPYGVHSLNERIERALAEEGLIERTREVYVGRPVMITANDHAQRLYNGDVGVVLPDPEGDGGGLRVFFDTAEGVRRILPSRLPPHETVYAMTVHKSQGSELDEVLLTLPQTPSRAVTRELVYTGITRARRKVILVADPQRLKEAIANPVRRYTGLHDALREKELGAERSRPVSEKVNRHSRRLP